MQKDSKGMLGEEVTPELADKDEPPFTIESEAISSEYLSKTDSKSVIRSEVKSDLTDRANSQNKQRSKKEFESVLDVAVQYLSLIHI